MVQEMPIPKEILDIKRPTNTVVIAYGKDKNLFAVRQRVGCKNVGGRHIPVNGPTIGHIVSGKYVPIDTSSPPNVSVSSIDFKDWANVIFCDRVFSDIQEELLRVYSESDTLKIFCISVLRVCEPGIKDYELYEAYDTSFLSEKYPGVALSKNTVSKFLNDLGKTCSRIAVFMRNRAAAVGLDHSLLVDGTLKSDESTVNSLSDYSRKARTKGRRDISVLYAFDLEAMEPVCSKCFPGNMPDITAYEAFIAETGITKGIIVADKGFPASAAQSHFKAYPQLHYLNPIKRNSKLIETHALLDFTALLPGYEGITFRKEKCMDTDKHLYSYRDSGKAAKEEQDWLRRAKTKRTFNLDELRRKQRGFGTIVLESDLDMPSEVAYKAYAKRWEIEVVMRYYKTACEFDETRVHDDYSVIGSEFCDFLSALLTFRLINTLDKAKILERMTYKRVMTVLARAKKVHSGSGGWQLIRLNRCHEKILQELDILPKPASIPTRRRGRPKKTPI
jgi:hypothetical protein